MTRDDLGPPGEKERPGATPDARPNQKLVDTTTNQPQDSGSAGCRGAIVDGPP
jgi:hypothetical protein